MNNAEIYAADSRAAGGDAGDSGGRGDSAGRVPEPQSAGAGDVSRQGVGGGEQVVISESPGENVTADTVTNSQDVPSDQSDKSFIDNVEDGLDVTRDKAENVPSDDSKNESPGKDVTAAGEEEWEPSYALNMKKLFEEAECGCFLPKWRGAEWRDMENGHRVLWYVGTGLSETGKVTKRRKYGKYFTHKGINLIVRGEYAEELETFKNSKKFGKSGLRSAA